MLASFFMWGVSLYILCWLHFYRGGFLLYIPCWLHFDLASFSYTSHAGFIIIWGAFPKQPVLASFSGGEFLLHIPCWFFFLVFFLICWVSLKHPVLASFLYKECFILFLLFLLLHIRCWGVSLTRPVLSFFFLFFYLSNFSYTSHVCFISLWGVSLTRPMLVSFSFLNLGSFSSTSYAGFIFYVGSFSYTSRAGFVFIWGVSLIHPMLVTFLSSAVLLHIACWLHYLGSFS